MLSAIERIIIIATPDITTYCAENAKVSTCLIWRKKLIILISQALNPAGKGYLKNSLRGETWDIEHKQALHS